MTCAHRESEYDKDNKILGVLLVVHKYLKIM